MVLKRSRCSPGAELCSLPGHSLPVRQRAGAWPTSMTVLTGSCKPALPPLPTRPLLSSAPHTYQSLLHLEMIRREGRERVLSCVGRLVQRLSHEFPESAPASAELLHVACLEHPEPHHCRYGLVFSGTAMTARSQEASALLGHLPSSVRTPMQFPPDTLNRRTTHTFPPSCCPTSETRLALEGASKAMTQRRRECSLRFIENGNIPGKEGIPQTEEEGRWGQYISFHVTGGPALKSELCSP